jgi:nickel-dependent lactate racemase
MEAIWLTTFDCEWVYFDMLAGKGSSSTNLSEKEVRDIITDGTPRDLYTGKRVLVLTPDATRSCPLPMMIRQIQDSIGRRAAKLDYMVALGTHPPMPSDRLMALYGINPQLRKTVFADTALCNHRWDLPETFACLGFLEEEEIETLSGGLLKERIAVDINRMIFNYDLIVILGPVFPHEVAGFSGGAKYLFPGISGGAFLHFFHWLGAVITCEKTIGIKDTAVRKLIHRAMEMIKVPIHCLAMVVRSAGDLAGLYVGDVVSAWSHAADLSERLHVVYKQTPYRLVFGRAPQMYDEIWVAGKVMYKLEQVVADGGTLIIFGPHIREISRTWGKTIEKIGYHVRDYFLAQMDRFEAIPRGVLAHSTHVRGTGTYADGKESPRINVELATAIPEEICRRINLGYRDPTGLRPEDYMHREAEGILFVDHAGEILYKLEK